MSFIFKQDPPNTGASSGTQMHIYKWDPVCVYVPLCVSGGVTCASVCVWWGGPSEENQRRDCLCLSRDLLPSELKRSLSIFPPALIMVLWKPKGLFPLPNLQARFTSQGMLK